MNASTATPPAIIQGGMGIGVSDWKLARAVSRCGQLGVVSGTAIDSVLARRLQDGDLGGHMRRAMERFPLPKAAAEMLRRHFKPGGRAPGAPYSLLPMHQQVVDRARQQITMLASFVEVHLAKHGHRGPVGINLLTKVQMPNLASLYGAMLAGVDYVLMGAGIPREIPGALDALAEHRAASLRLEVEGDAPGAAEHLTLDPGDHFVRKPAALKRPRFLPIIASNSLATLLARKGTGRIDGFVIEGPTAGGHNAPPRGAAVLNARGEPLYGERDVVDLPKLRELGLPFWLAGGTGSPARCREAREAGAAGVQVGTLFAYCDESGITEPLKRSVLEHAARGEVDVRTDAVASPTGYPFKVVERLDDLAQGKPRERVCDLGYLRTAYRRPDGRLGYRCPSEPVDQYVEKGGDARSTEGRRCLCNALFANIGLGQTREDGRVEPPLLTSGDDLMSIGAFLAGRTRYTAADVVRYLLGDRGAVACGA
jgi:NAD(P)H-dependent flavin oxidoreductase YrpB (nitropropane dioxygenase family)